MSSVARFLFAKMMRDRFAFAQRVAESDSIRKLSSGRVWSFVLRGADVRGDSLWKSVSFVIAKVVRFSLCLFLRESIDAGHAALTKSCARTCHHFEADPAELGSFERGGGFGFEAARRLSAPV